MRLPATSAAVDTLVAGLLDDAALFPPGNAPMAKAVPGHDTHWAAWYGGLVGPFLCPQTRLDELAAAMTARTAARPLDLGLIVTSGPGAVATAVAWARRQTRVRLRAVEVALPEGTVAAAREAVAALGTAKAPGCYVEVPRVPAWREILDVLAAAGLGAKLRTGGLDAAAFPTEKEVAAFILACQQRGVRFKCTAGLHHAVRHTAADTGFEHHGFLNVALATQMGAAGAGQAELVAVLAQRDPDTLARAVGELTESAARQTRRWFASFGTCSIGEPIDDLLTLGLVSRPS